MNKDGLCYENQETMIELVHYLNIMISINIIFLIFF